MAIKRIIWTNNVDTSPESIKAYRQDVLDEYTSLTDDQIVRLMYNDNSNQLSDECINLNISIRNPIVVIADLGPWNGRRTAYKVLNRLNVNEIFSVSCDDFVTFYADTYNIHCEDIHHDGINRYLFRELTGDEEQCRPLLDTLYSQEDDAKIQRLIRRYSRSLLPYVANIFGWPVAGRRREVA